jgi:disulfide bond formation protein DsbB
MYEIGIDTRYAMLISGIGGLAQLYAIKQSREGLTPMKLAYLALWAIGFAGSAYVTVQIMRE